MIDRFLWIGTRPPEDYDPPEREYGSSYREDGDMPAPVVRRPIGFVRSREKPRVRVKAGSQPIIER